MAFTKLKEIGLELTEKSPKIMQSWLIILYLTATIGIYFESNYTNLSIVYPPEVVGRFSETQLQLGKQLNY